MEASRAESTVTKYSRAFVKWEEWCKQNNISPMKAKQDDLARYFVKLYNDKKPYSTIENAFYAMKWKFDCNPEILHNPCDLKFLKLLIDGFKRILAKPTVQKEPITTDMLSKIVSKFGNCDKLMHIRMCAIFLISFAGFFRNEELINLRLCDVELSPSHVKFFVSKSKTDQYREGSWVVIASTGNDTCPVAMLSKYLSLAGLEDLNSDDCLFKPLLFRKSVNSYAIKKGKLSYNRCREILHFALHEIGQDPKKFGLHSLRSGGASAAAALGVPDRLIKKQGRWKADASKDRYIKENLGNRLRVSSNLGL